MPRLELEFDINNPMMPDIQAQRGLKALFPNGQFHWAIEDKTSGRVSSIFGLTEDSSNPPVSILVSKIDLIKDKWRIKWLSKYEIYRDELDMQFHGITDAASHRPTDIHDD